MAFTDPLSVDIGDGAVSLPRVSTGPFTAQYQSSDGLLVLKAQSQYGKRNRHVIRLDASKLTADAFIPTSNVKVGMSHYLVFDMPPAGYSNADALAVFTGFKALYTASSNSLITKILGGES